MVVECHRYLNQSLQESFLVGRGGAPDIFQDFVRLKEMGTIKKSDSTGKFASLHAPLWHSLRAKRPKARHLLSSTGPAFYLPKIP